ncbi:MAG TPA: MgtC/SapB family protein [Anaeromyxobacter sp.]|nr:MgtC/SapB family protein [Anaeromyxobacter sp.]
MGELRSDLLVLGRLLLAAVLGGALGWERFRAGKWVGVRTLMVVAMASALFVCASLYEAPRVSGQLRGDPIWAIQAIAVGIGFMGAGIIHVDREGGVRGLTTAATAWATAAVGIAVALGHYLLAAGATALLLLIMRLVSFVEPKADD